MWQFASTLHGAGWDFLDRVVIILQETATDIEQALEEFEENYYSEYFFTQRVFNLVTDKATCSSMYGHPPLNSFLSHICSMFLKVITPLDLRP